MLFASTQPDWSLTIILRSFFPYAKNSHLKQGADLDNRKPDAFVVRIGLGFCHPDSTFQSLSGQSLGLPIALAGIASP